MWQLLVSLAMAGSKEQVFEYPVPAGAVAEAWADAVMEQELGGRAPERFAAKVSRLSALTKLDDSFPANGEAKLGPLEYDIRGTVRVEALGVAETRVTLAFDSTNTLGEQGAWKKLGARLAKSVDSRLESAPDQQALRTQTVAALQSGSSCGAQLEELTTSPFGLLGWAEQALPGASDACALPLASSLAHSSEHTEVGVAWLLDDGLTSSNRDAVIEVLRGVPNPSERVRTVLAEADARRAEEAARQEAEAAAQAAAAAADRAELRQKAVAASGSRIDAWLVDTDVSPMDDSLTVDLSSTATKAVSAWPGGSKTPVLHVRCREGRQEVFVWTGYSVNVEAHGMSTDRVTVMYRLDDQEARQVLATASNSREGTFFSKPAQLLPAMEQASSMVFRFTPLNSEPVTTSFRLDGLPEASRLVRAACAE